MGVARYKTSDDGRFRLWVQQTGISGNNAVLTAWIVVNGRYNSSSAYTSLTSPRITVNSTYTGANYYASSSASEWVEVYRKTGILAPYQTGATGGSVAVSATGTLSYETDGGEDQFSKYESVSANYTLDTRTVASTMTFTAGTLGANQTFTISAAASSYDHAISYSCGSASGTVSASTASRSISWTIPEGLGAQAPAAMSVPITYTLQTISGGNVIGTVSYEATITVPAYSYTLGSLSIARGTAYTTVTAYVAGKTDMAVTYPAAPALKYGATGTYKLTITQGNTTVSSVTLSGAGTTKATPTGTGTTTATITFTDSRGVSVSKSASVTYVANTLPTVSISAFRTATSGGTVQDVTGLYYRASASGTFNSLSGQNSATLTLVCGSSTSTATSTSGSVSKVANGSLAATNTLSVTATVRDYLGNVASTSFVIPQGFAVVQFGTGSDHKGVSIGKVGQVASAGKLEVGYNADFDGYIKKKSSYVYKAELSAVSSGGYIKFAHILIKGTYTNDAIEWSIVQREAATPITITLRFLNANSKDPNVAYLYHIGKQAYVAKTNSGEWDVYVQNAASYNSITVCDEKYNYQRGGIEITYNNEYVATLPEVYIASVANPYYSGGGGGTGTITGVSVNGTSVATSGVANITSVPASIVTGTFHNMEVGDDADFDGDLRVRDAHIPSGSISREMSLVENWESGHYGYGDGKKEDYGGRIRFDYYIPIMPGKSYKVSNVNTISKSLGFRVLDKNKNLITSVTGIFGEYIWSAHQDGYYIGVFLYDGVTLDDIANGNIKVSFDDVSDTAKKVTLLDGAKTSNTGGYSIDTYGNFVHQKTDTSNTFCIKNASGGIRASVNYESGDATFSGGITSGGKRVLTTDDITPSGQIITAISLTAAAISTSSSSAICAITNRSYTLNGTEAYINVQCVLSSGVSLAGNDWWRLVRDFPMPKGASASTSDMGVSLNAVLYKSNGDYAGQVDAHIAYHSAETNRPAGWYLRVHTNVQLTAGMKVIASGSYLI